MKKVQKEEGCDEGGRGMIAEKQQKSFRIPYGFIGKVLLGTVAVAGVLAIGLAAPNVFQVIKLFEKRHDRNYQRYQSLKLVRSEIQKLAKKKLIIVFERDGEPVIRLTEAGQRELLRYQLKEKRIEKKSWDRKWRLIIFDIAEKKRYVRDRVRHDMQSFGFEKLQDSVWAYPYECEQVVGLLKAQYKIGKELLYIVTSDIEGDEQLKRKFSLR